MSTIHLISHTHWDREWYRTFQEFRLRLVHLIDHLLEILESDPEYKYYMLDGQTVVLEDYLAMRPERFEELRNYVQSGRILVGPWHILPDEFLVSSESIVRNLLQGARTSDRFGQRMLVGYTPDPFGHIAQLPQILRGFGIDAACLQRGLSDEPADLWWQAPDGSTVFLAYQRDGYGNGANIPYKDKERALPDFIQVRDSIAPYSQCDNLLVMQGTDHMEPFPETAGVIDYINHHMDGDQVIHSTIPAYIEATRANLQKSGIQIPTVVGELRSPKRSHLLPGVLSTRMWIKQRNQASQELLEKWTEPFSTLVDQLLQKVPGGSHHPTLKWIERVDQPGEIVRQAWHLLLENHPHDSICGCSIDQVHKEMQTRFDQVDQIGEVITGQNLQVIAESVNSNPPDDQQALSAIVVFNPNSFSRTDSVTTNLQLPPEVDEFIIVDEQGEEQECIVSGSGSEELVNLSLTRDEVLPMASLFQSGSFGGAVVWNLKMQRKGSDLWADVLMKNEGKPNMQVVERVTREMDSLLSDESLERYHVRIASLDTIQVKYIARNIPSLGYKTFWVKQGSPSHPTPDKLRPDTIQNEFFTVEAERPAGTLKVTDRRSGVTYPGLNLFLDGGDRGDEYNFNPPENDTLVTPTLQSVEMDDCNGIQTLYLDLELDTPESLGEDRHSRSKQTTQIPIHTEVKLYPGVERIDIHTTLENTARDHRLRVFFPAPFQTDKADFDEHYAVLPRPVALPSYDQDWIEQPVVEKPQRAFASINDGTNGLTIANRGLPEVAVIPNQKGSTDIAVTLLRSVGWLSRGDLSVRRNDAGPALATPGAQLLGHWEYDYAIIPHQGDWRQSWKQAVAFNSSLRSCSTTLHTGSLPSKHAFIEVAPAVVEISALKTAEDGVGWILRGYNRQAEPVQATIKVGLDFKNVYLARLDESRLQPLSQTSDGSFTIDLPANKVFTIRFE